ncbi:MAG: CvpA family protein [Candidatus Planktophila sp.]
MNFVDILIVLAIVASFISGYRNGFLKTIFAVIGNIGGAIVGLLLALNVMGDWALDSKKVGIAFLSIFVGSFAGRFLATLVTKGLKATVIRGPLAFLDQIAGAGLSLLRALIFIFLIGAVLSWSPWQSGKDAIAKSDLYPRIESSLPGVITSIKDTVQQKLEGINLRP